MTIASGNQLFYNSLSGNGDSSYTFNIENTNTNLFSSVVGLANNMAGNVIFKLEVTYIDDTINYFQTPAIDSTNSGYSFKAFIGDGAKTLKLIIDSNGNPAFDTAIWGSPRLLRLDYEDITYLTDMPWNDSECSTGWGSIGINKNPAGGALNINGTYFERGIGVHAFNDSNLTADVSLTLHPDYGFKIFESYIGINIDENNGGTAGSVEFIVEGDGNVLYSSGLIKYGIEPKRIIIDIENINKLVLKVTNGDGTYSCDWATWGNAKLIKDKSKLDDLIQISNPIDGQTVVLGESTEFNVTGKLFSITEAELFLNDEKICNVITDDKGLFNINVNINSFGENIIKITNGELTKEVSVFVAKKQTTEISYTISSDTTNVVVQPAENGIIITSLMDNLGIEWLDSPSFIAFTNKILKGGKNGTLQTINWIYKDYSYNTENVEVQKINVAGDTLTGIRELHTFKYVSDLSDNPELILESVWYADPYQGPIQHYINIINNSNETILVYSQDTMVFDLSRQENSNITANYSYKGAVYTTGYGYRSDLVLDGYNMNVFCSADYNNGYQIDAGYIPWLSINSTTADSQNGVYFGLVWSDGRIEVNGIGSDIYVKSGLDSNFITEIKSGGTYYVPTSFVGTYNGKVDDGSNQMKKWLFAFMMPEANRLDDALPSFEFNLWELLDSTRRSWRMTDDKLYEALNQLKELGIEEIMVDTYWWKDIGDWRGVHENWESSMEYSVNYAQALGLIFGIYMQAGNGSSTHPDALSAAGINSNPNWFSIGDNTFWSEACLADEDAANFILEMLANSYMEFGLNTARTDFSYILGYCDKEGHNHIDNRIDVAYWTSTEFYNMLDYLYEAFPVPTDVNEGSEVNYFKWENCNCGGTLKDFASMSKATRIQTTDAYDAIQVRQSFYDSSYAFPSMQLMLWFNDYMYNSSGPLGTDNYRFWGMLMGAPCTMISMPSDMPTETYNSLKRTIEIYDDWMKELVKYGNVYHNMPRADGINWDGIEYYNPDTEKGAIVAFKPDPNGNVDDTYTIKFDGIDLNKNYYVWSEDNNISYGIYSGADLYNGLALTLEGTYRAEIIYFMDTTAVNSAEIVSVPNEVTVSAQVNDEFALFIEITDISKAEYLYYEVINSQNETIYSLTTDYTESTITVNGLIADTYSIKVTAKNRFGSADAVTTSIGLEGSSQFLTNLYNISSDSDFSESEININGEYYIDGIKLELPDSIFSENKESVISITNLNGSEVFSSRIALNLKDKSEIVKVELYAVDVNGMQLLTSITLNSQNTVSVLEANIPESATSLYIKYINNSEIVINQTATGYGRIGLYCGVASTNYVFTTDVKIIRSGLNETYPRAGIMAAYINDNNFSAFYIDAYYKNIVIYNRSGSISSDITQKYKMDDSFDYSISHNLKVIRNGNAIEYYVDDILIDTLSTTLAASNNALITEDAVARFGNVSRENSGYENLIYTMHDTTVNINDTIMFGGNIITEGKWQGLIPEIITIV
jgi:hypothetical protein